MNNEETTFTHIFFGWFFGYHKSPTGFWGDADSGDVIYFEISLTPIETAIGFHVVFFSYVFMIVKEKNHRRRT